jgi:hypothetical protein
MDAMRALKNALMILRTAAAIPLGLLSLALMASAVILADGHAEMRRWWAAQ